MAGLGDRSHHWFPRRGTAQTLPRHHAVPHKLRKRARSKNRVIQVYSWPPQMAPQSSRASRSTLSLPPKPTPAPPTSRTRPRKSLSQTFNTNPNAYPRTDPVRALNVLLKLLTSLPSRIGGCQYKLTQPEQALSLHLIGILDPFVYHGVRALVPNPVSTGAPRALSFGLVDQPTEIIDAILFHVESRKDLLNIGLGCKRLYDVVFPRHIEYRVIRCKVSSISVWNHLVHHRSLARNVRRLEILDERTSRNGNPVCVPRGILQGDTDLESTDDELSMHAKQERFLAAALVRMTGLKEFKWSCNHSPISIAHIWPTLMMRAVNLNAMDICDNLVFAPVKQQEEEYSSSSESEAEDSRAGSGRRLMTNLPASVGCLLSSVSAYINHYITVTWDEQSDFPFDSS